MSTNIQQNGSEIEGHEENIQNSLLDRQEDSIPDDSNKVIEENLKKAGGFNRYQKFILFFFVLIMMQISMANLSQSFIYMPPTFICNEESPDEHTTAVANDFQGNEFNHNRSAHSNVNQEGEQNFTQSKSREHQRLSKDAHKKQTCGEDDGGCVRQILDPNQKGTYTISLDMYCEESHWRDISSSMLFVGSFFGSILLGIVGDIYGRKPVLLTSWMITSLSIIGISFTQNIPLLITMNFIFGFFSQPVQNLLLLLVNEEISESHRQMSSQVLMMAWCFGELALLPLTYLIQDFRDLMVYWIMIPSLILNIPLLFVIESPSYFLTKNKLDCTFQSLKKIASFNGKELAITDSIYSIDIEKDHNENILFNFIALFKFKSLRGITISSSIMMMCTYLFYFGSEFALEGVGTNLYINDAVASVGELIPLLIGIFIIPKIKRKTGAIIANIGCILICLSYSVITDSTTQTVFIGLLRISNGFSFSIFQVYIPELFPTQVRSVGTGIIFGIGNLGSVVSPFIVSSASSIELPEMVFIGLICTIGCFVAFFLKETFNKPLENQIKELRKVDESTQIFSPPQRKN